MPQRAPTQNEQNNKQDSTPYVPKTDEECNEAFRTTGRIVKRVRQGRSTPKGLWGQSYILHIFADKVAYSCRVTHSKAFSDPCVCGRRACSQFPGYAYLPLGAFAGFRPVLCCLASSSQCPAPLPLLFPQFGYFPPSPTSGFLEFGIELLQIPAKTPRRPPPSRDNTASPASPGKPGHSPRQTPTASHIASSPQQSRETPRQKENVLASAAPAVGSGRISDNLTLVRSATSRHQTCPHWIEMNVVDESQKRPPLLYHQTLVARLKNMSALFAQGIEADSESALQPPHSLDQVSLRSFHRKIIMVIHDHIRVEEPLALSTYLKKCLLKIAWRSPRQRALCGSCPG